MTRKELVNFLNNLEEKYSASFWMVDGIHVWPIIKIRLFFEYFYTSIETKDKAFVDSVSSSKSLFTRIKWLFISLFKTASLFLKTHDGSMTMLFSDAKAHYSEINNKLVNRFFSPIETYLKSKKYNVKFLRINYGSYDLTLHNSQDNIVFISQYYFYSFAIWDKFLGSKISLESLPRFEEFLKEAHEKMPEICGGAISSLKETILKEIQRVRIYTKIFNILLKKRNIRWIMQLCYYNEINFALNNVAYQLGIKTIDIQHGGVGQQHIAYGNWWNVPSGGYNVLPRVFWVWDNVSCTTIQSWVYKQHHHEVLIGGNPWLDFVMRNFDGTIPLPVEKKIILYTVQRSYIEDYIYDAISATSKAFEWWIRLHPTKSKAKGSIVQELDKRHLLSKVNIDDATFFPLPLLLKSTYIHVSAFSGAVIEAAMFNVPSIVLDSIGVEMYQDYINSGLAVACIEKSSTKLISLIENDAINSKYTRHEQELDLYFSQLDALIANS